SSPVALSAQSAPRKSGEEASRATLNGPHGWDALAVGRRCPASTGGPQPPPPHRQPHAVGAYAWGHPVVLAWLFDNQGTNNARLDTASGRARGSPRRPRE